MLMDLQFLQNNARVYISTCDCAVKSNGQMAEVGM